MNTKYVILNTDEAQALADMVKEIVFVNTKYYCTEAQEDLTFSERCKFKDEDIDAWWDLYGKLVSDDLVFDDDSYEYVRHLVINLDFGIFAVLEDNDVWADNPMWLYHVMCAWKKLHDFVESNKCQCCAGC